MLTKSSGAPSASMTGDEPTFLETLSFLLDQMYLCVEQEFPTASFARSRALVDIKNLKEHLKNLVEYEGAASPLSTIFA